MEKSKTTMKSEFEAFEIAMLIKDIYSTMLHVVGSNLQDSGLTHQQIMIITLIAHHKEINISELCKEMALTKGTVSGIVERLESADYIQKIKHKEDKRNTYVIFSEKGHRFAKEFRGKINDSFQKIFKNFTSEEMAMAKKGLLKFRDKIKEQK